MNRRGNVVLAAVLFAASWIACVGDDPTSGGSGGPATGDRLGACFPDDKCKEGLECRLPERICLTPGEPVPPDAGGGDASGGGDGGLDVSATDATDAADGGVCTLSKQAADPGPYCAGTKCGNGEGCCFSSNVLACNTQNGCASLGSNVFFQCDGTLSCGGAGFCCLLANPATGGGGSSCGGRRVATSTLCSANVCEAQQKTTVCSTAADCPAGFGTCVPTEIELAPNQFVVWGTCAK